MISRKEAGTGIVRSSFVLFVSACTATSGISPGAEPLELGQPTEPSAEKPDGSARQSINDVDLLAEAGSLEEVIEASEPAGLREEGSGAFRTHCLESHLAYDDPLVWPEQPGMSHLHVFFGNPNTDACTTTASLRGAGSTACDGVSINNSGYWVPTLLSGGGERIPFIDPLFYCKTG